MRPILVLGQCLRLSILKKKKKKRLDAGHVFVKRLVQSMYYASLSLSCHKAYRVWLFGKSRGVSTFDAIRPTVSPTGAWGSPFKGRRVIAFRRITRAMPLWIPPPSAMKTGPCTRTHTCKITTAVVGRSRPGKHGAPCTRTCVMIDAARQVRPRSTGVGQWARHTNSPTVRVVRG